MTSPDMCSICGDAEIVLCHDDHYFCETCVQEMKDSEAVVICPVCDEDITALVYDEESTGDEDEDIRFDSSEESE